MEEMRRQELEEVAQGAKMKGQIRVDMLGFTIKQSCFLFVTWVTLVLISWFFIISDGWLSCSNPINPHLYIKRKSGHRGETGMQSSVTSALCFLNTIDN